MALQQQKFSLSITDGIDTKTDAPNVIPTKFLEAENIKYDKLGSATKRYGFSNLTQNLVSGGTISAGTSIAKYNNEIVMTDTNNLYAYSADTTKWVTQDAFRHFSSNQKIVIDSGSDIFNCVHAIAGSTIAYIYTSKYPSGYGPAQSQTLVIKDLDTDTILYTRAISSVLYNIAAISTGYLIADGTSAYFFTISTLTLSSAYTNANNQPQALISDGTYFYMAGINAGDIQLRKISSTPALVDSVSIALGASRDRFFLSFESNGAYLRVTYGNVSGGANVSSLTRATANLATVGHAPVIVWAATDTQMITSIQTLATSTTSTIYYQGTDASVNSKTITSAGTVGSNVVLYTSANIISAPLLLNSKHYMALANKYIYSSTTEQTVNCVTYLLESSNDTTWTPVAYFNKDTTVSYGLDASNVATIPKTLVAVDSNTMSLLGIAYSGFVDVAASSSVNKTALTDSRAWLSSASEISKVYSQNSILFNGAMPLMYDGTSVVEQGFISRPQITNITTSGGASWAAGTYQFVVVYAYRDANGNIYRSAASDIQTLVLGGAATTLTLAITPPNFSLKDIVELEVYRTIPSGSLFYKVNLSFYYPAYSTAAVLYQTDANLVTGEQLYTDGGALDYDSMQPSYHICLHKNRIFSINTDRQSISYSQIIQQGYPVSFSDAFDITLNSVGGKLAGISTLDNFLVLFKENGVFALTGDGPNNLGQQDDYGEPQPVTTDTGCQDRNTIVTMPQGIMFNSPKGIYLLNRSLTMSYLGSPVEAYNGTMYKAILMPGANEVRFCTAAGTGLTYDYYTNRWSTVPNQSAIDYCLDVSNNFYYLTSDGIAHKQSTSLFTDNAVFVPVKLTTAWISMAGLQGYERFYRLYILGSYKSAHSLKVSIAYNFIDSFTETVTIDVTALPSTSLYEVVVDPQIQKCTSFKIKIEDVQNGTAGESLSISNLAMLVGLKAQGNKRGEGYRFGAKES